MGTNQSEKMAVTRVIAGLRPDQWPKVRSRRDMYRRARCRLAQDGFLLEEAGPGAVAAMRAIKRALDPDNLMNPGKIFA